MSCEEIKKMLTKYIQHVASDEEIKKVEEHLCVCHDCRTSLGDLMDKLDESGKDEAVASDSPKSKDKGDDDFEIISSGQSPQGEAEESPPPSEKPGLKNENQESSGLSSNQQKESQPEVPQPEDSAGLSQPSSSPSEPEKETTTPESPAADTKKEAAQAKQEEMEYFPGDELESNLEAGASPKAQTSQSQTPGEEISSQSQEESREINGSQEKETAAEASLEEKPQEEDQMAEIEGAEEKARPLQKFKKIEGIEPDKKIDKIISYAALGIAALVLIGLAVLFFSR